MRKVTKLTSFLTFAYFILSGFVSCNTDLNEYDDKISPSSVTNVELKQRVEESEFTLGSNVITIKRKYLNISWKDTEDLDFSHVEIKDYNGNVLGSAPAGDEQIEVELEDVDYDCYEAENDISKQYKICTVDKNGNSTEKPLVEGWILAYFKSEGGYNTSALSSAKIHNSLYLATSLDGLNYKEVNGGNPVMTVPSSVGSGSSCIRDPYVYRKQDGTFVMIATDWTNFGGKSVSAYGTSYSDNYWGTKSPCLIFSDSDDLINWKNTRCIRMVTLSAEAMNARGQSQMHVWAPEVILDDGSSKEVTGEKYTYGVIWSGDGNLSRDAAYKIPASNTSGYDWANRTYINYTNDFVTFTEPYLYFQNDYTGTVITEIDASITKADGKYYLFFKNEAGGALDISAAVSSSLKPLSFEVLNDGKYISRTDEQDVACGVEGSFQMKIDGMWWMIADHYGNTNINARTNFWAWSSKQIDASPEFWKEHANDGTYTMPVGVRHATAFRATASEINKLRSATNFTVE